jgi:hypothetical protein
MPPKRIPRASPRPVREFEAITRDGRVFHFPRPSWPRRFSTFHSGAKVIMRAMKLQLSACHLIARERQLF